MGVVILDHCTIEIPGQTGSGHNVETNHLVNSLPLYAGKIADAHRFETLQCCKARPISRSLRDSQSSNTSRTVTVTDGERRSNSFFAMVSFRYFEPLDNVSASTHGRGLRYWAEDKQPRRSCLGSQAPTLTIRVQVISHNLLYNVRVPNCCLGRSRERE